MKLKGEKKTCHFKSAQNILNFSEWYKNEAGILMFLWIPWIYKGEGICLHRFKKVHALMTVLKLVLGEERGNRKIYFLSTSELLGDHY